MAKDPRDILPRPPRHDGEEAGAQSDAHRRHEPGSEQRRRAGNACFPHDTEVLTPRGWEAIGGIRAGDLVLSLDRNGSDLNPRTVICVKTHGPSSIWTLRFFGCDRPVRTTETHSFL